jgi:RNA polymerase sigma factor (sigma-70 family)
VPDSCNNLPGTCRLGELYIGRKQVRGRALDGDDALIERARQGDADAYAALVERYQELAFRTAYVVVGDAAEAEDAAQEAFINAFSALRRFRPGSPFRPWMLRIVANAARNRRKAMARRGHLALRVANDELRTATDPPDVTVVQHEQRQQLLAAIEQLRDDDRLVIACRYLLELSEEETASALGCPRGTVKSRLSRALGRLRAVLVAQEPAGAERIVEAGKR